MRQCVVLVDASFLWAQLFNHYNGGREEKIFLEFNFGALRKFFISECERQFPGSTFIRIYWYDAANAGGRAHSHSQIEATPNISLRLGAYNSVGDQKIVDGLIVSDLITLSMNRAANDIILVSGDSDLIPGVTMAKSHGARVNVLGIQQVNSMHGMLHAEADDRHLIQESDFSEFVKVLESKPEHMNVQDKSQDNILEVASATVYDRLDVTQRKNLQANGVIPKEIDSMLIREAYMALQRPLQETEKRFLRSEFKRLAT